ncbi:MAG: hypothetical protein AAF682_29075 [Planctomycetota bacterium]
MLRLALLALALASQDRIPEPTRRLEQVAARVERALDVRFDRLPAVRRITRAEAVAHSHAMFERSFPAPQRDARMTLWTELGLLPEDFPFELLTRLSAAPVRALYDSSADVILAGDAWGDDDEGLLFHELVHALQDQEHDAFEHLVEAAGTLTSDELFAWKLLIEGEAHYWTDRVGFEGDREERFRVRARTSEDLVRNVRASQGTFIAALLARTPALLVRLWYEPATRGRYFVHRLVEEGGARAPRRLFDAFDAGARTPTTHALFYPEEETPPHPTLQEAGPTPAPLRAWTLVGRDRIGAFAWQALLEARSGDAEEALRGWRGDRVALYELGEARVCVGTVELDREARAAALAELLRAVWGEGALVVSRGSQVRFAIGERPAELDAGALFRD